MPISASSRGLEVQTEPTELCAVWTMNHAAGCSDASSAFMDTRDQRVPIAHPVFLAGCVELPFAFACIYQAGLTKAELVTHTFLHHLCDIDFSGGRHIRADDVVQTRVTLPRVEQKRSGVHTGTRYRHYSQGGEYLCSGYFGGCLAGLNLADSDADASTTLAAAATTAAEAPADVPTRLDFSSLPAHPDFAEQLPLAMSPTAAHVWDACIRNPRVPKATSSDINVHTNWGYAVRAGLPARTANGLSVLALAVSALVARHAPDRPDLVRRVCCRFSHPVYLERDVVHLKLHVEPRRDLDTNAAATTLFFKVSLQKCGTVVLDDAALVLADDDTTIAPVASL